MNKEFYIGWMPDAPKGFAKHIKTSLLVLLPLVIFAGITFALLQKKFSTGNFEFGKTTVVKGIYFNKPVPVLKIIAGKDIWGNETYLTVPLVGYGKHGADGIINDIEKERKVSLNEKEISLKGTLLYNDGKTILQIDANDSPLVSISSNTVAAGLLPVQKDLGNMKVRGEIIDPKCYFGVMKPGEGKVHRDCAIRCILGGIPPVMRVRNEKGESNYYMIVGPAGEKMNTAVQDYVGEPIEIDADLIQQDDWIIMYVKDMKSCSRISPLSMLRDPSQVIACGKNCIH